MDAPPGASPRFAESILDSSGKSPAQRHHREDSEARTGNGGGLFGFLKSNGGAMRLHKNT